MMQFFKNLTRPKNYLLLVNVFLVFFLIFLNNKEILPLRTGDFVFFAFLFLAFALYRPGWMFLLFIGTLPLENINLAPESLGIAVRPYQFFGALVILAIIIRKISGRLNLKLIRIKWHDYLIILMSVSGFLSLVNSPDKFLSFRLSVIFTSFVVLYFLTRNYIQNSADLKKVIPFFLSSSAVVVLYGIWQNIAYLHGGSHYEIMPGRPNATFAEADWLGIYLVLMVSVCYAIIYYYVIARERSDRGNPVLHTISRLLRFARNDTILFLLLASCFILLILTVSRSAWLGAFAATFIFLFAIFTNLRFRGWRWKETLNIKIKIFSSLIIAIAAVYIFHLTDFQLLNRAQSTGSGLQKITVSCVGNAYMRSLPREINDISELGQYNCQHINLEDIEKEKAAGNYVSEIYRKDPNVNIRAQIYQKSWKEIKKHPLSGIGWGSIGEILGKDENRNAYNSSNIFLEMWLGAGAVGLVSLIVLLVWALLGAVKNFFYAQEAEEKAFAVFIIASWFGLIAANMFNAGIFLGFLWVWLAVVRVENTN